MFVLFGAIVKVTVRVPVYPLIPWIFTLALPALTLFVYDAIW